MSAISLLHDLISRYWRYIEILSNPNSENDASVMVEIVISRLLLLDKFDS